MATDIKDEPTLRFQIDPTPDEARRACVAILRAILPPDRSSLILIAVYAAVVVAAYYLTPTTTPLTILIGVLAAAATAYSLQAYGRARLRRLQTDDPHAREPHFVELSPDGLRAWCDHVDARYPWRDFVKIAEDQDFYLFVRPSGTGAAIPKRLLDDALDSELRRRIREWAPDHGAGLARELTPPR